MAAQETDPATASATGDVTIAADPALVYDLITDLPTLAELAEETTSMRWRRGDCARAGAVFKGSNRHGVHRWSTTCTVTEAEPGRAFAFDVSYFGIPIARWRYDIAGQEGGCRVSESTWDRRPGWFVKPGGMATGVPDRDAANAGHIRLTLHRLKARAETAGTS
jgi:hypothetical protein